MFKNRTGAIYKIQAGDRVWHLNFNEPAAAELHTRARRSCPVSGSNMRSCQGNDYTVFLTNLQSGQRKQTTVFTTPTPTWPNAWLHRRAGLSGSTVAWRHIRIKT